MTAGQLNDPAVATREPTDDERTVANMRAQFPALERMHGGQRVAYFDGPGGTQVPRRVVDAMSNYLYKHNANTHWAYPSSAETDAILLDSRAAFADMLNATPDEISFGANMTTIAFHVARAIGRTLQPGDEVVITDLDHHANVAPWVEMARDRGVTVRSVPVDPVNAQLDWNAFERLVTPRTRVVAVGAASNAVGTISDVARATTMAHAVGALAFVDAVHYAPHEPVDVGRIGCDLLACSAYKFYGPHIGVLYGRRDLLESLDVPRLQPAPDNAPDRLETGTQNHEGIAGAAAAVAFLESLGTGADRRSRLASAYEFLHRRGHRLFARLWEGLEKIPRVRRYGPGPDQPRTPTVAFTIDGLDPEAISIALAARGIFASHGDFYASTIVELLGQQPAGLVRVGAAAYTTDEEIERVLEAVDELARR